MRDSIRRTYIIYQLVDPRDSLPHYVGYTSSPKERLGQHIANTSGKSKKDLWIAELKGYGLLPSMEELEKVVGKTKALKREAHWITQLKKQGMPLTNVSGMHDFENNYARLTIWVFTSKKRKFVALAKDMGMSQVELMEEAVDDLFKKYRRS
jgi:predicted GIY-YIG superfamily endonuclease